MPNDSTKVTIVGAGLAGALLAGLLAEAGHDVTVFEWRPDPRRKGSTGGRSINLALSTRGLHALRQAGLTERVLADAIPMRGRMIHSPAGRLTLQPYSKNPRDAIHSVSRGGLNIALVEAADRHRNVAMRFEHRCVDIDPDRPAVTVLKGAGGRAVEYDTDLVIGCDGAFSAVRGRLQRLDRFDYSQSYLEHGYKELTIPPTDTGDFAMEPRALHIWPRGGSMMIALPNADRSFTCTCFWPLAGPDSFAALRGPDEVRAFFESSFPDAARLMPDLVEEYERNPVGSLVTIRCAPWHHEGKVVLVGDAAHAIVPFYGQGMNAAFEDCVALVASLGERGDDRAAGLEAYYRARKVNADAIADLAIENFLEMRDRVASPVFRLKKRAERVLHRLLGWWYTPLYNLVSFSRIPYAEARRRAARQGRVVAAVVWIGLIALALAALGVLSGQWS